MSKIIFEKISYKNFQSVGNSPIAIELNKHKTTLISGANGAGKSCFLSAISFALFGRAYGVMNKPALVNSINQKNLLVELDFHIEKKKYKVKRGIKPNIFEIYEDGKLINQDPSVRDYQKVLEQRILKFNYRGFSQVIAVGGTDYVPFMKLSSKDRREFVEDLLDIRVFSVMNNILKDRMKDSREQLKDITTSIKGLREKISLQDSFIKKLKSDKKISVDKIRDKIFDLQTKNSELNDKLIELSVRHTELENEIKNHDILDKKLSNLRMLNRQLQQNLQTKKEKHDSYKILDTCPTCSQPLHEELKNEVIADHEVEMNDIESMLSDYNEKEKEISKLMSEYDSIFEESSGVEKEISQINREIFSNSHLIRSCNEQLNESNADTTDISSEELKLKEFAKDYVELDKEKRNVLTNQQYQEYLSQILSDSGIKSKVIKTYIPTINRFINKYLNDLDLFVSMSLDEQFNETFKSRHRDTFSYDNFSDGQKRRIDIAILFAWMEIARAKNSISTNIVIFDEIDSSIDSQGTELFLQLLNNIPKSNVFLISHKSDLLSDKVDSVLRFELKDNFTILDEV